MFRRSRPNPAETPRPVGEYLDRPSTRLKLIKQQYAPISKEHVLNPDPEMPVLAKVDIAPRNGAAADKLSPTLRVVDVSQFPVNSNGNKVLKGRVIPGASTHVLVDELFDAPHMATHPDPEIPHFKALIPGEIFILERGKNVERERPGTDSTGSFFADISMSTSHAGFLVNHAGELMVTDIESRNGTHLIVPESAEPLYRDTTTPVVVRGIGTTAIGGAAPQ